MSGHQHRRVVIVQFSPSGGLFQFDVQLAEGLASQGCRVVLLTGHNPEFSPRHPGCVMWPVLVTWHPDAGRAVPEWVRRLRRVQRAGLLLLAWCQVLGRLARLRPDVVLLSGWRFGLDGFMVTALRRLIPAAVLAVMAHEPVPLSEQPGDSALYRDGGAGNCLLRRAYHCVDVIFVLGDRTRERLLEVWQPTAPVVVIPHGEEGIFVQHDVQPVDLTEPVALFFGTITTYKGWETLLQAWPRVLEQVPGARLVMAGKVNAGVDRADLEARVRRVPSVRLHADYVPAAEVPALFEQARVVALPYLRSSQSGVAHLAQTFGRPVVASNVGDIPDVVIEGVNGVLCDAGDVTALADALTRLLADPGLASRLGAAGRQSVIEERSWPKVAGLILDQLPAGPPPRRRLVGRPGRS